MQQNNLSFYLFKIDEGIIFNMKGDLYLWEVMVR